MQKKLRARRSPAIAAYWESMEARAYMAAHIAGNATNYATIQAAVNAAAPGATINVDAGNYAELVTIDKQLNIRGARAGVDARTRTGAETVVTGTSNSFGVTGMFYVAASGVTIDGFTLQGQTTKSTTTGAAIVLGPGISGSKVVNNVIQNNVAGLFISNNSATSPVVVQYNSFKTNNNAGPNSGRGIYTDGEISGGNITNVVIDSNSFTSNFGGVGTTRLEAAIAFETKAAGKQSNIRITNNYESGNGKGMLFFNTTGVTIQGNTVTGSKDWYSGSLRFEGNNHDVTIAYNTIFANTGPGVAVDSNGVEGDNSGFVVTRNNIYGNGTTSGGKLGVVFNQSVYDGTFDATNNYWGNATGPGGDGPGTGDTVYGNAYKTQSWNVAKGGTEKFSPWATALINITAIPAPTAPTGLAAVPLSSTQIGLTWTTTSNTATGQLVQRSTDGVNFSTIATVSALTTAYTDSNLTAGTTYAYRVLAANGTGTSAASNTVSAAPAPYQAPVAPRGLTATATSSTAVSLTWVTPSYAFGIVGYRVLRNGVAIGSPTATSFVDSTALPGTSYAYAVATVDSAGAVSAPTNAVTVSTPAAQFRDRGFETTRVATAGYTFNTVTANWTFAGRSGIASNGSAWGAPAAPEGTQVAFIQGNGGTIGKVSQSIVVNPAGQYTISLSAAGRSGYGTQPIAVSIDGVVVGTLRPATNAFATYSTAAFAMTAGTHVIALTGTANSGNNLCFVDNVSLTLVSSSTAPSAPTGLTATSTSATQVRLSWSATGATPTSFVLQRSTDNVTFTTVAANIAGTATAYVDSAGVTGGTTYYYRLTAVNGAGSSVSSNVASATTLSSSAVVTPLSSVPWTSATSGYRTPQLNESIVNNPIVLRGQTYPSGIGTHAVSTITYNLAGKYSAFQSDVGVDDAIDATRGAAVIFRVYGDGVLLYDSGVLTRTSATATVAVSLAGVQTLTLVATNGVSGTIDYDHADWAGAQLLANPSAPAAPTAVSAVALSATSAKVSWAAAGSNQTGFKVERSVNGTVWSPVATVGGAVTSYTDATLTAATSYSYRVRATNAVGESPNSAVATVRTPSAAAVVTNLSSLNWTTATTGFGEVTKDASMKDNVITLRGTTYASGIGTHAESTITYNLAGGGYTGFLSDVGIDDEVNGKGTGSAVFKVYGDGVLLYDSGVLTNGSAVASLSVNLTGVQTLTLVAAAAPGGDIDFAHADWAGARLISA